MNSESRAYWQRSRFDPASPKGHYESYFLRANHPEKPQAFWIRYTIFAPAKHKPGRLGEVWAIWFDGDKQQVVATKNELPLQDCRIDSGKLQVLMGDASLVPGQLNGHAETGTQRIAWQLAYDGDSSPIEFLPRRLYDTALPKAKSVVTGPNVMFNGTLTVNGETMLIRNWQGSENHNWGEKHTDEYAWGQVAGFDHHPEAFLECITARVKLGPLFSPWLSIACLRLDGKDYFFNTLKEGLRAKSRIRFENRKRFISRFSTRNHHNHLRVILEADREQFVGLNYYNPPGGSHTCLNSKIAHCRVELTDPSGKTRILETRHRAAFEILTDSNQHGVSVMA